MEKKDILEKISEIRKAVKDKNYNISYEEPNNIRECTAADGSTFLMVVDMDDARSSNDFGSNTIEIADEEFTYDLNYNEWESCFFDEIRAEYHGDDAEELIEEIQDTVSDAEGFIAYECDSDEIYRVMTGDDKIQIYDEWGDHPMDEEDFIPIEAYEYETISFQGTDYYIIYDEDPELEDEIIAVSADEEPDKYGTYKTVTLILKEGKVVSVEENDERYGSEV